MATSFQARTGVEQLYVDHQPVLLGYLTRLMRDQALAEDVCQESFVKALHSWDKHMPGNTVAWLYRIARNTAYDELRRRRRIHFAALNESDAPEDMHDTLETRCSEQDSVQQALMKLPTRYRVPLVLHVCMGYSVQEIATMFGCSRNTVKAWLFRARMLFRRTYQG